MENLFEGETKALERNKKKTVYNFWIKVSVMSFENRMYWALEVENLCEGETKILERNKNGL